LQSREFLLDLNANPPYLAEMQLQALFTYQPGVNLRKERALRMISEGRSHAEVRYALQISHKTLAAWIRAGLPAGDPELDQVSLVDGLTERERRVVQV
jgi:DNA-binding CsgD family transcriptional regulator